MALRCSRFWHKTSTHPLNEEDIPLYNSTTKAKCNRLIEENQDEKNGKQKWSNSTELLLSIISLSVGLGNVWRFPYTAYENGGGAFLLAYIILVTFISRPLYFLESCLGQFSSHSMIRVWEMVPLFRGIGFGQALACCYVAPYYTSLISLSVFYFFVSFSSVLPWILCNPNVTMKRVIQCQDRYDVSNDNDSKIFSNKIFVEIKNEIYLKRSDNDIRVISPAEQFFSYEVLKVKESIGDGIGLPDAALVGCLALCYAILFLSMYKGVKSLGKASYINAIFPYIVLIVLTIKSFALPGALQGLKFLFIPKWEALLNIRVWYNAIVQSFFSLGVGYGTILNYASFNPYHHNFYR